MPLVVYLHGASGKGDDLNILKEDGICKWIEEGYFDDIRAYMIFPQLSSQYNGWNSYTVRNNVMSLIDFVVTEYKINGSKISLTGHSMGGTGTFNYGSKYPDVFSAIAPMSGSMAVTDENIEALINMPVWAFVGSEDTVVAPEGSIDFINALNEKGGNGKVTVFEGASHVDVPELAYLDENIDVINWLIEQ